GTYVSQDTGACTPCDYGTYQDAAASTSCVSCPNGTSTYHRGAHDSSLCRGVCGAGNFSATGLEPCRPCPRNYIQNEIGQTGCSQC
ncbi:hypothetical protein CAPTEDRAFT_70391, partial [Capitella teleta]